MSNKKNNQKKLSGFIAEDVDSNRENLSGSSDSINKVNTKQNIPISLLDLETQKPSLNNEEKKEQLIIPIEDWSTQMSQSEMIAYKTYKQQSFPEMFEVKNCKDDKLSEVPFLSLTKSARLLADLLETTVKLREEEQKNKITH